MSRAASKRILNIFRSTSIQDKELATAIKSMVGSKPLNISLYQLAISHSSIAKTNNDGFKESNERLEYLGDAILGSVVAAFLFKKFPFKDEGFLTEIRSRIVNRESLNLLGRKIGLANIITFETGNKSRAHKSIYGNALEALVGAVYLDRGYAYCSRFIIKKLLIPHYDLDELINTDSNHKSKVIEWAQRQNKQVAFDIVNIKSIGDHKEFTAHVMIDSEMKGEGFGHNKKKAEQAAAYNACEILEI